MTSELHKKFARGAIEIDEKKHDFSVFGYNVLKIQLFGVNSKEILCSTN